jgi:hypothetical protein
VCGDYLLGLAKYFGSAGDTVSCYCRNCTGGMRLGLEGIEIEHDVPGFHSS